MLVAAVSLACSQGELQPPAPAVDVPITVVQPSSNAMESTAVPSVNEITAMNSQGVSRLQVVRGRGTLVCSSNNSVAGFGFLDARGNTVGFDIDLCRAVAEVLAYVYQIDRREAKLRERRAAMPLAG